MSYGLVFGAIAAIVALVGLLGGLVWWVRRPVVSKHDHGSRIIPLFGNDMAAVYARQADDDEDDFEADAENENEQLITARAARARSAPALNVEVARPDASATAAPVTPTMSPTGSRPQAAAPASAFSTSLPPSTNRSPWAPPARAHTSPPVPSTSAMPPASYVTGVHTNGNGNGKSPSPAAITTMTAATVATSVAPSAEGQAVRFTVPTDRTLQFLPGKLEIVGGLDAGREVRFVRLPNEEAMVTFGRQAGLPYRHVQLPDPTVSRSHARMRMRDGRWLLTNLSTTNPVLHNGEPLTVDTERELTDGDRVEMGEVVFRYRA